MDRDDWNRRYAEKELVWSAGPNLFLVEEIERLPARRAVDLAAGEGRNAVWLAEQGWQVTAVDYSRVGLDKGREIAKAPLATIDYAEVAYADTGIHLNDSASLTLDHVVVRWNHDGLLYEGTGPPSLAATYCDFVENENYGVEVSANQPGTDVNIARSAIHDNGGTCEGHLTPPY